MRCAGCGARVDQDDNYCRRCGVALNRHDLSTVVSSTLLPVPWSVARGPVVRGVAALVLGTAVELVRRELARRAASHDHPRALSLLDAVKPVEAKPGRFPWSKPRRGEYEVTETVIQRTVRFFRR